MNTRRSSKTLLWSKIHLGTAANWEILVLTSTQEYGFDFEYFRYFEEILNTSMTTIIKYTHCEILHNFFPIIPLLDIFQKFCLLF